MRPIVTNACGFRGTDSFGGQDARLRRVHHKPLYFLIGEASSRYRRPVSPRLAVERLMLLDAVLVLGDVEWLTSAAEKAAYLAGLKTKVWSRSCCRISIVISLPWLLTRRHFPSR